MLKEDYLMRFLQQFNESLAKWLSKKKSDSVETLNTFNQELVKPYVDKDFDFFENKSLNETITFFESNYPKQEEAYSKIEILSELFYQYALLAVDEEKKIQLLQQARDLLLFLMNNDKTFSIVRENKLNTLNEWLGI
jgi:hypothetical protein